MIPAEFKTKEEKLKWIVENKDFLIAKKKSKRKHADAVGAINILYNEKQTFKANQPIQDPPDQLKARLIINTTNIIDSHQDMHLPGIWNKSLRENKMILHLQEHRMEFDKIISSGIDLKATAQKFDWVELGFPFEGKTEALVFNSKIKKDVNDFMHKLYSKGVVNQHSVGMEYVKMLLAVNDEAYPEQKEIWDKYIDKAVNPDVAIERGFFWVVKEAKVIEGSAVVMGSNYATPTLNNNKAEPGNHSDKQSRATTQNLIDKLQVKINV